MVPNLVDLVVVHQEQIRDGVAAHPLAADEPGDRPGLEGGESGRGTGLGERLRGVERLLNVRRKFEPGGPADRRDPAGLPLDEGDVSIGSGQSGSMSQHAHDQGMAHQRHHGPVAPPAVIPVGDGWRQEETRILLDPNDPSARPEHHVDQAVVGRRKSCAEAGVNRRTDRG
jgi:hypothetical protein